MDERFMRKVVKTDSCWLWAGALQSSGYGHLYRDGRYKGAHRYSYEQAFGEIPTGLVVCHRCDVKRCVNPDHLFVGTYLENAQDMKDKGRSAKGHRNGSHTRPDRLPRGQRNAQTKISDAQVANIRMLAALGARASQCRKWFPLSASQIERIIRMERRVCCGEPSRVGMW